MYKYAKSVKDGKVNFLKKYKYNDQFVDKDPDFDYDDYQLFVNFIDYNEYPMDKDDRELLKKKNLRIPLKFKNLIGDYVYKNRESVFGEVDLSNDISNDNLTFVKSFLIELDACCSLYETCEIDNYSLTELLREDFNNMLYYANIFKYEKLDYLDNGDRSRANYAFNYLFSNLTAITIINHDDDKKFRDLIFSGNNNYKDMLAAIKIDIDSVNYEKEVNNFIYNYELKNIFEEKKSNRKVLKKIDI